MWELDVDFVYFFYMKFYIYVEIFHENKNECVLVLEKTVIFDEKIYRKIIEKTFRVKNF